MNGKQVLAYKSYWFGMDRPLEKSDLEHLTLSLGAGSGTGPGVLGGRGSVTCCTLEKRGPVVIKSYRRGGLIRHIVREHFLKWGKTRSCHEYEMLKRVRELGVAAPEPVAHIWRGRLFYRCWLVTEEIQGQRSLAEISLDDEARCPALVRQLGRSLHTLIENGIWHVDFHPGNVLVDPEDQVYIIDFDKARTWNGSGDALYEKYLSRWRRAVAKYNLPDVLNDLPR